LPGSEEDWEFFPMISEGDFDDVSVHELFDDAETEAPKKVVTVDNRDDAASDTSDAAFESSDDDASDNSDDDETFAPSKRLAFLTETENIPDKGCPPSP
jgi:hypothetical protein